MDGIWLDHVIRQRYIAYYFWKLAEKHESFRMSSFLRKLKSKVFFISIYLSIYPYHIIFIYLSQTVHISIYVCMYIWMYVCILKSVYFGSKFLSSWVLLKTMEHFLFKILIVIFSSFLVIFLVSGSRWYLSIYLSISDCYLSLCLRLFHIYLSIYLSQIVTSLSIYLQLFISIYLSI